MNKKNIKNPFNNEGMFCGAHPLVFKLAKDLRSNMTDAEKLLWNHLKTGISGCKFRRQHPISIYIADFYCHKIRLVIEVDGNVHEKLETKQNDSIRERNLIEWKYKLIRFKNEEVFNNLQIVLMKINAVVEEEIQKINLLTKAEKSSL